MARKQNRTYTVEVSGPNYGWLKLENLADYDIERWLDLLSNTHCTWSLTCKVEEDETNVQGEICE